jgi:hypothetical protein
MYLQIFRIFKSATNNWVRKSQILKSANLRTFNLRNFLRTAHLWKQILSKEDIAFSLSLDSLNPATHYHG